MYLIYCDFQDSKYSTNHMHIINISNHVCTVPNLPYLKCLIASVYVTI